ncbi:hypothetical protein Tco_1029897 [Tanacetum coccineum]|uniref:Uncharacterized protein n=1 Tax=Tanacetum coccineum TaxID=301880 RepID=A0ABQ5G4Z4_9ASTR
MYRKVAWTSFGSGGGAAVEKGEARGWFVGGGCDGSHWSLGAYLVGEGICGAEWAGCTAVAERGGLAILVDVTVVVLRVGTVRGGVWTEGRRGRRGRGLAGWEFSAGDFAPEDLVGARARCGGRAGSGHAGSGGCAGRLLCRVKEGLGSRRADGFWTISLKVSWCSTLKTTISLGSCPIALLSVSNICVTSTSAIASKVPYLVALVAPLGARAIVVEMALVALGQGSPIRLPFACPHVARFGNILPFEGLLFGLTWLFLG